MSLTSKSPRTVILVALAVGRKSLADHAHRCSPKVFTQPQLFACLALMAFLRTDFRGIEHHLRDCPCWQQLIGLKRVPEHATLGMTRCQVPLIDTRHRAGQSHFMPRSPRKALSGIAFHVLNRGSNRAALFDKEEDYDAFERILEQACIRFNMRLLAYCLMPNHWHLLPWPRDDGDLSRRVAGAESATPRMIACGLPCTCAR